MMERKGMRSHVVDSLVQELEDLVKTLNERNKSLNLDLCSTPQGSPLIT